MERDGQVHTIAAERFKQTYQQVSPSAEAGFDDGYAITKVILENFYVPSEAATEPMARSLLPAFLLSLANLALAGGSVWAQRADVAIADRWGDFISTRIQGNRGFYSQRQWLIITQDPDGLNCRDQLGQVIAVLAYGSVVDSDLAQGSDGEGIILVAGRPWLRLSVNRLDLHQDLRPPLQRNRTLTCRVRAHSNFVAPLNPDTF